MFERYEKEIELLEMEDQKGIAKIKYNKLLNILTVKVYFQGKRVTKESGKVHTERVYRILESARDENIVGFIQFDWRYICAKNKNGALVGDKLARNFFIGLTTNEKIEKIIIKNKARKNS